MTARTGSLAVELGCWVAGLAMVALYIGATVGLENERREGIELFAQARAAENARVAPLSEIPNPDRIVDQQGEQRVVRQEASHEPETAENGWLPVALLRIPGVDLEVPVFDDISERNLSRGAGWIPGTALPNDGGNMAIAAHRDQYFRALKDVAVGDLLELESLSGPRDYRVASLTIVQPEDLWPLDPADEDTVTLVTCYPFYFVGSAPQRYIVQAVAVD